MSLKLDNSKLEKLLKDHLDRKSVLLEEGLKDSLESPVFSWGSVTVRKNGETVSDPRDAVDTGNLQESIRLEKGSGLRNKIRFEAEYSEAVMDHSNIDFVQFTVDRLD